ncbi:hypothetical protein lbkm_1103 [Lachnospiraceae bacterium KM106-2]|nr:hypothetical protein lbkm_1103 [Lachnospiraceae bacterium KM106-2]
MNNVGRPHNYYDITEVDEIIKKMLISVEDDISKLTYHSVSEFNKRIVTKKCKNYKGEIFTNYGTYFWSGSYKGQSSFGKQRIDFYKQHKEIRPAGECFEVSISDIEMIFDNNRDDIETIKRRIIKLFKDERHDNINNEKLFSKMQKDVRRYKELVEEYKNALFTIIYNSQYSNNSLNDFFSMHSDGDSILFDELHNIFNDDINLKDTILEQNEEAAKRRTEKKIDSNIINMAKMLDGRNDE